MFLSSLLFYPLSRIKSGFTLIELALVVTILSLLLGGGLTILQARIEQARHDETGMKMDAIEQALQDYALGNGRLPCPAAATTLIHTNSFGLADSVANCGGSTALSSVGSNAAGGVVPTKTLNLPDDYMFDGWGRRFDYAVDKRITAANALTVTYLITNSSIGVITVKNTTGGITISSQALVLLLSHGPNGHGGYVKGGSSGAAARLNTGITNTDELDNCNCTNTAVAGTVDATYIQKPSTEDSTDSLNNFDDIVRYYMRYNFYLPSALTAF